MHKNLCIPCSDPSVYPIHCDEIIGKKPCTKDYPFAYLNGKYCCKYNQEKVNGGMNLNLSKIEQYRISIEVDSGTCDGIGFSIESTCCKDDKYLKCPHTQCVTRPAGKDLS